MSFSLKLRLKNLQIPTADIWYFCRCFTLLELCDTVRVQNWCICVERLVPWNAANVCYCCWQVHEVRLTPEQVQGEGPLLLSLASSLSYGPPAQDQVGHCKKLLAVFVIDIPAVDGNNANLFYSAVLDQPIFLNLLKPNFTPHIPGINRALLCVYTVTKQSLNQHVLPI